MIDFKPDVRIKDPALLRQLKIEHDCCEITFATSNLHLHHVIYRSHRGDDARCNIVCLAEWFHDEVHAGSPAARRLLAQHIRENRQDVAEYIATKLGGITRLLAWYERHERKGEANGTR